MVRRRILAIPLALVVAIAVFISPVLCVDLPENTVSGTMSMMFRAYSDGNYGTSFYIDSPLGRFASVAFTSPSSLTYQGYINFDNRTSPYDIYIAVNSNSLPNLSFSVVSSYYSPSRNLSFSINTFVEFAELTMDSLSSFTSYSVLQDITYLCFRNVPPSVSIEVVDNNPAYPGGSVGSFVSISGVNYPVFTFGIFASDTEYSSDSIITDYVDGLTDFSVAFNNLQSLIDSNVSSAVTSEQAMLELLIGQQQIDRLVQLSNDKNLTVIYSSLNPGLESVINTYVSGSVTLDQAMSSMYNVFSSALSSAATPEQGELVSTTYQIALDKLQIQAKQKALDKLDSAISDDQLTEADDYYAAEEDLINQFELAEFESALDFELWFNTLPPSETALYKQFFDYLLNDSSIRMFLIIPISLVLVRLLMGTHLVLGRGGDHSSKTTVFDSDDHYRFYDDGFRGS